MNLDSVHTKSHLVLSGCFVRCGSLPQIAPHMSLDPVRMEYTPTLFFNEFWLLRDHLIPLNETVEEVTLHFSLSGMSQWKWTIFTQMEQSFNMQVGRCTAL